LSAYSPFAFYVVYHVHASPFYPKTFNDMLSLPLLLTDDGLRWCSRDNLMGRGPFSLQPPMIVLTIIMDKEHDLSVCLSAKVAAVYGNDRTS